MENVKYIKKINELEEIINNSIDLLEITKTYCDANFDKASEICSVSTSIAFILKEQKNLIQLLDNLL